MRSERRISAFTRLWAISSFTQLADLFVSPKTTLPWLVTAFGLPAWLLPLLVPLKESGALIPQWYLRTQLVSKIDNRMRFWRLGMVVQGGAILAFSGMIMVSDQKALMTATLLCCLLFMALGRAICSLLIKDIQAENIQPGHRGRLVGRAAALAGGVSIGAAFLMLWLGSHDKLATAKLLVAIGGILFFVALTLSSHLRATYPDITQASTGKRTGLYRAITADPRLMHLILSRVLLLHAALILPFIVSSSTQREAFALPVYIILSSVASLITSYLWGTLADKSAVRTLNLAAAICTGFAILATLGIFFDTRLITYLSFFILSVGYAGIRAGRQTYLLDISERSSRSTYVASSNTVVGVVLLCLGGGYAFMVSISLVGTLIFMSCVMAAGFVHSFYLAPEK